MNVKKPAKNFRNFLSALIFASFLLAACAGENRAENQKASVPPRAASSPAAGSFLSDDPLSGPLSQIRIPLAEEFLPLQVVNANLDIDQMEEQIIVFKKKNDPEDKIRIIVADFDNVRNAYVPAWETETRATNARSFSLELVDLLGDHIPEVLCFGRGRRGEETLDVFRKTLPPQGFGIYYTRIAALSSAGNIEVEQKPRSEAYRLLQRNDESFSLAVYENDTSSENINDLLKVSWFWSHEKGAYIQGKRERLAGQTIAEKRLAELFAKGVEEFEVFLGGFWYRTESGEIIQFDVKERRIIFFNGSMEEIFLWQSSYRTIYRGMYLNCANESLPYITKQLSVSVSGMDSFELAVKGEEGWDGQYKRLTGEMQASYLTSKFQGTALEPVRLSGLYKNENGMEIYFSPPRFTMKENGSESSGGYAVYSFHGLILEMKFLKNNGRVDFQRTYRLTLNEEKQGRQILRTLFLQPAELKASGVDVKALGEIRLQQIVEAHTLGS
ncbi:MAG: pallilysin-related adhesin [Spirochaetales bacterium]|jgi:hypothetical protein|nr:pallilysin-related adhesin [Spirochaetales bacterium]